MLDQRVNIAGPPIPLYDLWRAASTKHFYRQELPPPATLRTTTEDVKDIYRRLEGHELRFFEGPAGWERTCWRRSKLDRHVANTLEYENKYPSEVAETTISSPLFHVRGGGSESDFCENRILRNKFLGRNCFSLAWR